MGSDVMPCDGWLLIFPNNCFALSVNEWVREYFPLSLICVCVRVGGYVSSREENGESEIHVFVL